MIKTPETSAGGWRSCAVWAAAWLAAFLVLLPFIWTSHFGVDEFQFLYEAKQVAGGALPYRDFFEFLMPGTLLLLGGWFKLVGPSLLAARLLQGAALATLAVLAWRLARVLGAGRWLSLAPSLVLIWVLLPRSFGFSHHWLAQTGVGVTLALTWWALGRQGALAWCLVGLAAGITYAFQQLDGAALAAGLGAGLTWTAWRQGWGLSGWLRRAGLVLAGAMMPLGLLAVYFATQGALEAAWWATHIWPLTQYRAAGNHNDVAYATDLVRELSTQSGWLSRGYWYTGLVIAVAGTFLPLWSSIGGLAWLWGTSREARAAGRPQAMGAFLVFVATALFLAACRGRADLPHLLYMETPAVVLLTAGVAAWERRAATWPGAIGLLWLPRLALAGLVLAGAGHVAEVARRMPEAWLSPQSPDARLLRTPALQALAPELKPSDTLVAAPIGAVLTFYLAPNATRYSYWVRPEDGYTTQAQFEEILEAVRRKRPRFLVVTSVGDRRSAGGFMSELADRYVFDREVPYPGWEPLAPYKMYVFRRRDS